MLILGIDVGSSFIKTALYDLDAVMILQINKYPTPGYLASDGVRSEIAVDKLAESVLQQIQQIAVTYPLDGVIFSSQMHGIMLKNKDGSNLTNFITWQDSSCLYKDVNGVRILDYIVRKVPANVMQKTGVQLKSSHSICKLITLAQDLQEPIIRLALLGEAIIEEMTGQISAMSSTMAASTGLYDLVADEWNTELIENLGIQSVQLPPIQRGKKPVAEIKVNGHYIPIFSTIGDHQAAVLGCLPRMHDVVLNISTGSQISYLDDGLQFGAYETRPYFDHCSLRSMTHMPAGRSLNVLLDFVLDIGKSVFDVVHNDAELIWQRIDRLMAEDSIDANGLSVDLSFYNVQAVSHGGSITGICENNLKVKSLLYAAYQSMARLYEISCQGLRPAEDPLHSLICSGGVIRKSPVLLKCVSQEFGLCAQLSPFSEDVLIGLMRLAYWYSDYFSTVEETRQPLSKLKTEEK